MCHIQWSPNPQHICDPIVLVHDNNAWSSNGTVAWKRVVDHFIFAWSGTKQGA